MRKLVCVFLICITLCSLVACNNERETAPLNDFNDTEKIIDYSAAISSIDKAMESIRRCFDSQQYLFDTSSYLLYLYSDKDTYYENEYKAGGNYNGYVERGYSCYVFRKSARKELENAKLIIKGGSGDLHTAVQKYYLAVAECMNFVSNYPEGYSEFTWNNKWAELNQKASSAANEVDLYK